jgi:hypothetical protein
MLKKIRDHLEGVQESYFQHMFHAFGYGARMILGGLCALIHAICPAIFQTTASGTVAELHSELQARLAKAKARRDAEKTP